MIEFQNINKTYRVAKRQAGFGSTIKALFLRKYELVYALSDVSVSDINIEEIAAALYKEYHI